MLFANEFYINSRTLKQDQKFFTLCICVYIEIMEMSGVKIRDTVGRKVRENPFWFMLVQGFELPGVKIH